MNLTNIIAVIKKRWLTFEKNPPESVITQLSVATPKNDHGIMAQALLFWKFVRNKSNFLNEKEAEYEGCTTNDLKREFLQEFLSAENPYILWIAHIEMLPTTIWRKILWVYNLDFQGYESFLRRLSSQQIREILTNHAALFTAQTRPPVLKARLGDRLQYAFKKNLNATLLQEDLFDHKRYISKGAWAYSFLGLGMGFGKYPNGLDSDYELTNKKFSRFLSTKNHINDFVVNQEDGGIYWWLYQKARKNFVWKAWSKEEVKLKSHICPGFWATLIMHLIFWVISPLIFTIGLQNLIHHDLHFSGYNSIFLIIGCVTPLWIICASIMLIIYGFIALIYFVFAILIGQKRLDACEAWIKERGPGAIAIVGVFVGMAILKFIYWLPNEWLHHTWLAWYDSIDTIAFFMSSFFLSSIALSILEGTEAFEYDHGKKYVWTPFIWAFTIVFVLFMVCVAHYTSIISALIYIWDHLRSFFIWLGHVFANFGNFIYDHLLRSFLVVMGILTIITTIRPIKFFMEAKDRESQKSMRFIYIMGAFWIIVYIIFFVQSLTYYSPLELVQGGGVILGLIVIGFVVTTVMMRKNLSEDKIQIREKANADAYVYRSYFSRFNTSEMRDVLRFAYLHNPWFLRNNTHKVNQTLKTVSDIIEYFVKCSRESKKQSNEYYNRMYATLTNLILLHFDDKLVQELHKDYQALAETHNIEEILQYCRILVATKDLGIAETNYKKLTEKQKQQREKRRKIWGKIIHPLVWIYDFLSGVYDQIMTYYKLFNEKCPYVNKSKQLEV